MKPLNQKEVQKVCEQLQLALDARVQNVFLFSTGIVLEGYKNSKSSYMVMDLNATRPFCGYMEKFPVKNIKKNKPITLFLKAHAQGKRFSKIYVSPEFGRILFLEIGYEEPLVLELRLFPHGQNLIVRYQGKTLSALKPKELKSGGEYQAESVRSYRDLEEEWLLGMRGNPKNPPKQKSLDQVLAKKNQAIQRLEESIQKLTPEVFLEVGRWIQEHQTLLVPERLQAWVDPERGIAENLERIFSKAKELRKKREGALLRLEKLKSELIAWGDKKDPVLSSTGASGESLGGSPGELPWDFVIGRNAKENLKILRESKPWHLWLHLKDYPGAHGLIRFSKGYEISREDIQSVAQKIAERSRQSQHHIQKGDSFEVLVVEKRYVKPIKGDRLGRVRYSNEKVLSFKKN